MVDKRGQDFRQHPRHVPVGCAPALRSLWHSQGRSGSNKQQILAAIKFFAAYCDAYRVHSAKTSGSAVPGPEEKTSTPLIAQSSQIAEYPNISGFFKQ